MQKKGRKLESVTDLSEELYEERNHSRGRKTKPLYAFLPTLPEESETIAVAEKAFSCQYLSRLQGCLR